MSDFTPVPANRTVGSGNPPADMNNTSLELLALGGSYSVLNSSYAGGADPTGTDDSTAAINACLAAAPAGTLVTGPAGTYKTSAPLLVPQGVKLAGPLPSQQSALGSTSDWGFVVKPSAGFAAAGGDNATAAILIQEPSTSEGINRAHVANLMIDGSDAPADVDGIAFYGSAGACSVQGVLVQYATGNGVVAYPDADGNAADGLLLRDILAQACTGHGVDITAATDANMDNVHGQDCGGDGVRFTGSNVRCTNVRGDLSTNGITLLLPATPSGGNYDSGYSDCITLTGCGSQLNNQFGLNILDEFATADTTPSCPLINLVGCSFDMDGVNSGSGGGGYAGIGINGLCVVSLTGTSVNTDTHGVTDGSPEYAIATSASATGGRVPVSIRVSGASRLAGVTGIYNDAAPAFNWAIAPDTLTYVGAHSSHIAAANVSPVPALGWTAEDMGYAAVPYDPNILGTTATRLITAGIVYLIGMQVRAPQTIEGKVDLWVLNTPSGLDNSYAGLYNAAGTLLGVSADQSTSWESPAWKLAIAMTAEAAGDFTLTPGLYWVALLVGSATTAPCFATPNTSSQNTQQSNGARLGAANCRFGTYGTASTYTALPGTITPADIAVSNLSYFAGLY